METAKRSKRGVLLTDREIELLQDGQMDPKSRSKLHEKLDEKLPIMLDEIEIISNSKILEPWREIKRRQLWLRFEKIADIFYELSDKNTFKQTHTDLIRILDKKEKTVQYIDFKSAPTEEKKIYYTDRIFSEDYVLRGIKARPEVKKLLLKGYKRGIIHSNHKKTITLEAIKNKLTRS